VIASPVPSRLPPRPVAAVAVTVAGCGLLLARPWATRIADDPTSLWIGVFVLLAVVGWAWPLPLPRADAFAAPRLGATAVLTLGVGAFLAARVLGGGWAPAAPVAGVVVLNSLAAVAEEAFFRRLLYGLLLPRGEVVAVVGSAVAFAAVHVTVWGWWVLPIDLGAGLILSWQRWASGRWSVPAVTHVAANVLAVV
jgi:membrane protease YdiL (CAAX protease family)